MTTVDDSTARSFVEELLRTGLSLTSLASELTGVTPADATSGTEPAAAVVDALTETARPAISSLPEPVVREAAALLGAIRDRARDQLEDGFEWVGARVGATDFRPTVLIAPDPAYEDEDSGLPLVRWKARGFEEMRSSELLDRKAEFELVNGLVIHRLEGSRRHDAIVSFLAQRLQSELGVRAVSDAELTLRDGMSVLTADLAIFRSKRARRPELVVEVSDRTSRLDALDKARLYAAEGIPELWLIDLAWGLVYTYGHPTADGYGMRCTGPDDVELRTELGSLGGLTVGDLLRVTG